MAKQLIMWKKYGKQYVGFGTLGEYQITSYPGGVQLFYQEGNKEGKVMDVRNVTEGKKKALENEKRIVKRFM